MYKVLISDNVSRECVDILKASDQLEVTFNTKLTPDELKATIGEYDALVVRSATKVREEILEAAVKLKVIGRAGAGVDNISETNVDLHIYSGRIQSATKPNSDPLIVGIFRNAFRLDRVGVEGQAIRIHFDIQYFFNLRNNCCFVIAGFP